MFTLNITTMKTTTNYSELLLIENYINKNIIKIGNLDKIPRTIEKSFTKLDNTISINPNTVGALAPIFESIEIGIKWSTEELEDFRVTILALEYNYEHPSGSNGYDIKLYSKNGSNFGTYDEILK